MSDKAQGLKGFQGSGFSVLDQVYGLRGLVFRVYGLRGLGFRFYGLRGLGFRVYGLRGFSVWGSWLFLTVLLWG